MSYTYDQRKRPQGADKAEPETNRTAAPGPSMETLMSGRAAPSAAQKGQSFDLDAAMKAKMENAFGDLSAVKFYKSQAVSDAGAEAIAQGNEVAFAPGMTDFSTKAGQERLGHELSHVMSQRSGQVRGTGYLNNASLEARADREGAMAAAGQQIYTGPVTHTLSGAAPSPFVAGPMQAMRGGGKSKKAAQTIPANDRKASAAPDTTTPLIPEDGPMYSDSESGVLTTDQSKIDHSKDLTMNYIMTAEEGNLTTPERPEMAEASERIYSTLKEKYGDAYYGHIHRPANPGEKEGVDISGLMNTRLLHTLLTDRGRGFTMTEKKTLELMDKLMAPQKQGLSPQEQKEANDRFDEGMKQYKGILLDDVKHKEKQFGSLVTQMHPEDVLPQIGNDALSQDDAILQDITQFRQMGGKYLDPNNKDDQKFIALADYYNDTAMALMQYKMSAHGGKGSPMAGVSPDMLLTDDNEYIQGIRKNEGKVEGPRMNQEQLKAYQKDLKKRAKKKSYLKGRLFGRFKK